MSIDINRVVRLLESKKENGASIDLIVHNMIKRHNDFVAIENIIKVVYPDFDLNVWVKNFRQETGIDFKFYYFR